MDSVVLYRSAFTQYQITLGVIPTRKLLDQVRTVIRVKHFGLSTERAYVGWIKR